MCVRLGAAAAPETCVPWARHQLSPLPTHLAAHMHLEAPIHLVAQPTHMAVAAAAAAQRNPLPRPGPHQTVPACQNLYKNSFTYHTASAAPPPLEECFDFLGVCWCACVEGGGRWLFGRARVCAPPGPAAAAAVPRALD